MTASYIPPPTRGDVLLAVGALGFPRVALADGRVLHGERSWRTAVGAASIEERLRIWQALRAQGRPS